jgi:two-component system, NarL family, nitrate/nitrite response regulator NarL
MTDRKERQCVVLVASPSAQFRRRLSSALSGGFFVYQAKELGQMQRSLVHLKPSVLFIDLSFRGVIKSIKAIQRLSPRTKILVLSGTPDLNEAVIALQAGVKGYCHRDLDRILLRKAVQTIQKGEVWVERGIIPHLVKELGERKRPVKRYPARSTHLKPLTIRQRQIALYVSEGASNKEIASVLNITQATVKAHIHVIFRKLGLSDRLELALFVREKFQRRQKKSLPPHRLSSR